MTANATVMARQASPPEIRNTFQPKLGITSPPTMATAAIPAGPQIIARLMTKPRRLSGTHSAIRASAGGTAAPRPTPAMARVASICAGPEATADAMVARAATRDTRMIVL